MNAGDWESARWPIPLEEPPALSILSVGHHRPGPLDRYQIRGLWCLHLYRYRGQVTVDGRAFPICPGHAGVTPPGAVLEYLYDDDPAVHVYAHFSLPAARAATVPIPAMQHLGSEFDARYRAMEQAIRIRPTHPRRAEAALWDALWHLAERALPPTPPGEKHLIHPAVQEAIKLIELTLTEPIGVSRLARRVGLSRNHLTRLFRAATGTTVAQYVRQRRSERARHLLAHSTRPIKAVAAEVGIPDLHLFNKTIRRVLGRSPSEVRRSASRA